MNLLAIDTTGTDGYVALIEDGRLIAHRCLPSLNQTLALLPAIDQLLQESALCLNQIDFIAACTGPGTFTGTRIGVMTAKSLAIPLNKPLFGYDSFVARTPKISPIGKRRFARYRETDNEIEYITVDDPDQMPHATLNWDELARTLTARAKKNEPASFIPTSLTICYPI